MHPDWIELLESLNSHSVDYLVVGAAATAIHAQPRYADDLDLWLRRTEANVERLQAALVQLGFTIRRSDLHAFWNSDRQKIILGNVPSAVELFNFQSSVSFDGAWENRINLNLVTVPVAFVGLSDLVKIKRAANGYLDGFDLCLLEEVHGKL